VEITKKYSVLWEVSALVLPLPHGGRLVRFSPLKSHRRILANWGLCNNYLEEGGGVGKLEGGIGENDNKRERGGWM